MSKATVKKADSDYVKKLFDGEIPLTEENKKDLYSLMPEEIRTLFEADEQKADEQGIEETFDRLPLIDGLPVSKSNSFNGYAEAQKIDNYVNDMIKRYDMTEENILEWMKFARTLASSFEILLQTAITKSIDARNKK